MNEQEVCERIRALLPDARIEVSGADCNFSVTVASDQFIGQRPVARQQQVLGLFRDDLTTGALHALTVDACTVSEQNDRQTGAAGQTLASISL